MISFFSGAANAISVDTAIDSSLSPSRSSPVQTTGAHGLPSGARGARMLALLAEWPTIRSPIVKPLTGGLVVGSVTTSESRCCILVNDGEHCILVTNLREIAMQWPRQSLMLWLLGLPNCGARQAPPPIAVDVSRGR